ncbi:hypothetical protein Tco_1133379 [Tanacetum coccineum]
MDEPKPAPLTKACLIPVLRGPSHLSSYSFITLSSAQNEATVLMLPTASLASSYNLQSQGDYTLFRETMVLRVERKLFVIEQPISLASPTDSEYLRSGMRYMIHNEELKFMFEKQVGVEWFDLIQTFHAYKQDKGKPVGLYVIR